MTRDETWRKKQLKVSASDDCSVRLRRLFQMTTTIILRGRCCILRQTETVSRLWDGLNSISNVHLFHMTIAGPQILRRGRVFPL
jgi:hypothetical protein